MPPRASVPGIVLAALLHLLVALPAWATAGARDMGVDAQADMKAAPDMAPPGVAERLSSTLAQIEDLREVQVEMRAGVVRLRGKAPSSTARADAETIAAKFEGVLYVDNQIAVPQLPAPAQDEAAQRSAEDEALESKLSAMFAQVESLGRVSVRVRQGVVTLRGTVDDSKSAENAVALAGKLPGALFVNDQIEVPTRVGERVSPALSKLKETGASFLELLPLLAVGLVILAFFWWLSKRVANWEFLYRTLTGNALLRGVVRQLARTAVMTTGVLIVLELFGVTSLVGAVLGTAGVAGLAVGFAFKDIVENYLTSVILSLRQPFLQDDFVEIGSYQGKVIRMTTRDTVLMTLEGNHLRIPNAQVFKSVITNYSRNPLRRFDFVVGIGNDEDLHDAKILALEALHAIDGVLEEPEAFILIEALADSSVTLHIYGWVDQRHHGVFATKGEAIRRVKAIFDAHTIEMPVPIYQVVMSNETSEPPTPRPPRPERGASALEVDDDSAPDEQDQLRAQIDADRASSDEADLLSETDETRSTS